MPRIVIFDLNELSAFATEHGLNTFSEAFRAAFREVPHNLQFVGYRTHRTLCIYDANIIMSVDAIRDPVMTVSLDRDEEKIKKFFRQAGCNEWPI